MRPVVALTYTHSSWRSSLRRAIAGPFKAVPGQKALAVSMYEKNDEVMVFSEGCVVHRTFIGGA